jgi:hypothetical protein
LLFLSFSRKQDDGKESALESVAESHSENNTVGLLRSKIADVMMPTVSRMVSLFKESDNAMMAFVRSFFFFFY